MIDGLIALQVAKAATKSDSIMSIEMPLVYSSELPTQKFLLLHRRPSANNNTITPLLPLFALHLLLH